MPPDPPPVGAAALGNFSRTTLDLLPTVLTGEQIVTSGTDVMAVKAEFRFSTKLIFLVAISQFPGLGREIASVGLTVTPGHNFTHANILLCRSRSRSKRRRHVGRPLGLTRRLTVRKLESLVSASSVAACSAWARVVESVSRYPDSVMRRHLRHQVAVLLSPGLARSISWLAPLG